jgi:type II secretory pathway component GspD/PulD (secretin)
MVCSHYLRKLMALVAAASLAVGPGRAQAPAAPAKPSTNTAKSQKALKLGLKAEAAGNWQAAYDDYVEATAFAPQDKEAQLLRDGAKYRLVQQHMDAAEREALAGNQTQAEKELRAAIELDPNHPAARERLGQVQSLKIARQPVQQSPLAPSVNLHPKAGTHHFDFRGNVRAVYEEIARQFGLSVEFDTDLQANNTFHTTLPDVDFDSAMKVIGEESHTFWVAMSDKQFLVADDTPQKRKQFEPEVVKTYILPASTTDAQMTETLRVIRDITGITHSGLNTATRELTLRDTPKNLAIASELLDQLEQGRGEMVLEVELLEVDRSAARQLGLEVPTSQKVVVLTPSEIKAAEQATTTQELLAIIQSVFGTTSGGGALGGLLPPLVAFGGGYSTFLTTLPSTQLDLSQTYSVVRSAQRMMIRAEDGQPSSFFIGERFPITLALLSTNIPTGATFLQGALPRTDLLAGNAPSAVLAVSLRGTSAVDIVDANQTDGTISVFLGNGDGTFSARTDIPVGKGPVALATADFNGDGKADIAVVNQTDDTVSILLGNGDGTFTAGQVLSTGKKPSAILATDINADGHVDLAVANETDNTVSIFLNAGGTTGTFLPPTTIATGVAPVALAPGIFTTSGHLDLAAVNQTDDTVSIFLGNGDGTFSTKTDFPTGTSPSGIVTGNFTQSGQLDLAVSNQGSSTVSILTGNGDGTFGAKTDFQTGSGPAAILTGDFNGDGIPDLITADFTASTASVLIGDGAGNFSDVLDVPVGTGPVALAAADFNGDTRLDLAVAAQTANVVTVILNTSNNNLNTNQIASQTPYPGSEFEDVGLKVKATPHLHSNGEVTLQLTFEIRSISNATLNGIPIISNRTSEQTIRVRENEVTLLLSMQDVESMNAFTGWPGLGQIPGVDVGAGSRNTTATDSEFLIVVTPRMLHPIPHSGRSIYAGRDTTGRTGTPQQ